MTEVPLQIMERTMLEQISTGQPMEDVTAQQVDVP